MKNIMYILFATLLLWSCSNEKLDIPEEGKTPEGTVKITMKFPGRTLAPKTYAGTFPADKTEKSLNKDHVWIFVFSDKAGQPDKLLIPEQVKPIAAGDSEAGVTGEFFMRKFGNLHLVATANIPFSQDQRQKMLGQSFEEFSKTIVKQKAGVANAFAMTSDIVKVNIPDPKTNTAVPAMSFLLERLSARIDIENKTTVAAGGVFVLEGARLQSAIDRSFLVKEQSPALTIGNTTYGATAVQLGDWKTNPGTDKTKMYMQMYAYENVANTLVVQVKGTFKGQPAQFNLPFGAKEVKRNTRYVVNIKNVVGNKVNFEIVVKDWEEGGNINIKPDIDASKPKVTKIEPSNATGGTVALGHSLAYSSGTDPNNANAITLTKPSLYHTKITVESPSAEATIVVNKAEVPWVSVKELGKSSLANGKLTQTFLVSYSATHDLYSRTAELEIQNKFNPDKTTPHLIKITQPKATTTANHLARFANANVGALNAFADVITPNNLTDYDKLGKYYQWGRNIAFDYSGAITTTTSKSNGNDAALWSKNFISAPSAPYTWEATNLGATWTEVVGKATNAPTTYKGTNGGDPSPLGYRLPEAEEMRAIMPQGDRFNGTVNRTGVAETLKINDVSGAYTADYYSTTSNIIYALKMKDATNDKLTAYRYEYRGSNGLTITSRLLGTAGATTTVQDVAKESFWTDATKGGSDVIRYFPSLGYRSHSGGSPHARGALGYCWSPQRYDSSNAWTMHFNSRYANVYSNRKAHAFTLRPIRNK